MEKVTKFQIDFIIDTYFPKTSFIDARNIAEKLLIYGRCTVAGDGEIFQGFIGNFIEKIEVPDAVGCTLLRLDWASFKKSEMFISGLNTKVEELQTRSAEIMKQIKEIEIL